MDENEKLKEDMTQAQDMYDIVRTYWSYCNNKVNTREIRYVYNEILDAFICSDDALLSNMQKILEQKNIEINAHKENDMLHAVLELKSCEENKSLRMQLNESKRLLFEKNKVLEFLIAVLYKQKERIDKFYDARNARDYDDQWDDQFHIEQFDDLLGPISDELDEFFSTVEFKK